VVSDSNTDSETYSETQQVLSAEVRLIWPTPFTPVRGRPHWFDPPSFDRTSLMDGPFLKIEICICCSFNAIYCTIGNKNLISMIFFLFSTSVTVGLPAILFGAEATLN